MVTIIEKIQIFIAFLGGSIWGATLFTLPVMFFVSGRFIAPCYGMGDCFPIDQYMNEFIITLIIGFMISSLILIIYFGYHNYEEFS